MPRPENRPAGAPCWVDLLTTDPGTAARFYNGLFGWTATEPAAEFGGYVIFLAGGEPVGGCMKNDGTAGAGDAWSVYLATGDASELAGRVTAEGGQELVAPMPVGELGSMAIFSDPGQAAVGVWQSREFAGFGVIGEPGTPAWFELSTQAYDASVVFYRDVFGWDTHTMSDTPGFRYTTLGEDRAAAAGIFDASPEPARPSQWSVYFGVSDTDAAITTATGLGGTLVEPASDSPYGRLATLADPSGAVFKIISVR